MSLFRLKIIIPLLCCVFAFVSIFFYLKKDPGQEIATTIPGTMSSLQQKPLIENAERMGLSNSHLFETKETTNYVSISEPDNSLPDSSPEIEEKTSINSTISQTQKVESSTQLSLHVYANKAASPIVDLYTFEYTHPNIFTEIATGTPTTNGIANLIALANAHETAAVALGVIDPAPEIATYHKEILAEYMTTALTLRQIAEMVPHNSNLYELFKKYNDSVIASAQALVSIANVLKNNDISIAPTETGSFFLDIIP